LSWLVEVNLLRHLLSEKLKLTFWSTMFREITILKLTLEDFSKGYYWMLNRT
jgi:hypothetical protein